jgi:TonB-dependent receptor
VLSIAGSNIDASQQQVTGSSFRNSYMKAGVDQLQLRGKLKFEDSSKLDFGVAATTVENRSAFSNVQRDTWGGATSAADYPDGIWHADTIRQYFGRINGSNSPALFNQFYTFDFKTVRDLAAKAASSEALYQASSEFTTDRRTKEESKSAYVQYTRDWELLVPMGVTVGLRYEKTEVTSSALVPIATGISWGSNNELSVAYGAPGFTTLKGNYQYVLPNIDFGADLTDNSKLRLSYGESLGRPGWGAIQGGQTLNQLVRVNGGTGSEGNPGLKPLKSKNFDLSLEFYYAKSSYVAAGFFQKNIDNYIGTTVKQSTPFNLPTPINGALYKEAGAKGGCVANDLTCIRNYIFRNFSGTKGVVRGADDANGNATGTIAGQPGDPIATFDISVPANQKSASLHGVELNVQHRIGNTGFGVGANYTLVLSGLKYDNASLGEQFALEGLSNSANVVGYYENDKFNVRAAYNWRGEFLTGRFDGSGTPNPVYTEPYGQLDLTFGYKLNNKLTFQAEILNVTDGIQRLHGRTKEEVIGVTQTGRRYMVGARYAF